MTSDDEIRGVMHQGDRPYWAPLLAAVGEDVTGGFMWMFEVLLEDGNRLQAYKHIDTRRYVHLDGDGNAFYYVDDGGERGRYRPIGFARLLAAVLAPLWEHDLAGVTPEEVQAAKRAVRRARAARAPSR